VSTDPASSLPDALHLTGSNRPTRVPGARRLDLVAVGAAEAFQRWLAPRHDRLADIAERGTYLDSEDVARLLKLSLPGIDELVALLEIVRLSAPYGDVVVDTAPTGHTLRLLGSPALFGRMAEVLDVLQMRHRELVSALTGSYRADAADALIEELEQDGRLLTALLRDRDRTRMLWVTLPEPMAMEESADALTALARDGIRVHTLIVNRITAPPPGACDWCQARRRFEARAVRPIERRFAGLTIAAIPEQDEEPHGLQRLNAVRAAMRPLRSNRRSAPPVAHRLWAMGDGGESVRPATLAEASVQWLLFGGKGGVGKSTCAAAAALDLATTRPSTRVLLLSSDPAHSLSDVFGVRFSDRPASMPDGPPNLFVREIDAAAQLAQFRERYIDAVDAAFDRLSRRALDASHDRAAFRELIDLAPPGIDEVIAIAEVASSLAGDGGEFDLIVSDTAPTGHALRLLEMPGVLRDWSQALMAILLKYREIVGGGTLAELLVSFSRRLRRLQERLRDAARTRFVIVTRAAALPRAESVRLCEALRTMGIAVGAVVVNAYGAGECARCRARRRVQAREITRLRVALPRGRYAIIKTPAGVPPPHGVAPLLAWQTRWERLG
jgi:arsenite/tail-anchored protein-transporting ATPase